MRGIQAGLWALATLASFSGAIGQIAEVVVIDRVDVRGLERVGEPQVRSQIEVKPGAEFDARAVQRDIRRLYALGYFSTISAEIDRVDGQTVLVYIFLEEKFIDEVRIQGNKKIKSRQIRGAISWHEGQAFVREGYGEERDAVLGLYRSKGFLNSTVDIVVEPVSTSRVRVTYQIFEGKKARIKSIDFIGNEALSKRKLKKSIKTRRAFWFLGGRYDDEKFEADLLNVINEYANVGRLEAEIAATDFQYAKDGKRLEIDIRVSEGPEYRIGTMSTADNFVYSDDELAPLIAALPGQVHNRSRVNQDSADMQKLYRDSGYVYARVVPQVTLNREAHTTAVTHQVDEDELKYIREVRIEGNSITKDEVIRRNILLKPGERFDQSLKDISDWRLQQTGYFESHRLRLEGEDENDRFTNVIADVVEGKTGDFNFGGAYNSEEGLGGFGELRLRNFDITNWPSFSGGGQIASARFFIGDTRTNFRIGLTDPEFLGYPFSLGAELFSERFEGTGATDYTVETTGAAVTLGKRLSNFNTMSLSLSYRDTSISELDTFVDPDLRELEDPGSTLSMLMLLNRNTTNSARDPTRGADHTLSLEVADFGLDNEFVLLNHDSTWFYGLNRWKKVSFSLRTREGIGFAFGDKELIPLGDRLYAGGSSTIRGYDYRDVGPKAQTFRVQNGLVIVEEEPIGGELRFLNTLEGKYVLNEIIRLYLFGDSGAVFFKPEDFAFEDFRFSVGVGVGINVPFLGPLRVDYGYPLNPDDDQGSGQVHLQSSIRF